MSSLKRKAGPEAISTIDPKKPKANSTITSFFGAPKTPNGSTVAAKFAAAPEPPAVAFDKAKWVASLTEEQRKLLQLEIDTLHESWLALLKDDITSKDFLDLKRFLDRETAAGKTVFPPREDIYSWSRHTPFSNVKVLILGQDPYHNTNQAHGLAFSVRPPTPAPPSLKNMYIALKNDFPSFLPPPNRGGLLTPWATHGVLLLNTCLTVRAHEANSHSNRGWEKFTQKVIDLVAAKRSRGVVFMAWGTPAGKRVQKVDGKRHLVLKAVHPSPLSASRGFFTCGHFKKANEWLEERYGAGKGVEWSLAPGHSLASTPTPASNHAWTSTSTATPAPASASISAPTPNGQSITPPPSDQQKQDETYQTPSNSQEAHQEEHRNSPVLEAALAAAGAEKRRRSLPRSSSLSISPPSSQEEAYLAGLMAAAGSPTPPPASSPAPVAQQALGSKGNVNVMGPPPTPSPKGEKMGDGVEE